MSEEIPEEVYEVLVETSRRRGKSIEEIIIESVSEKLDPRTRVRLYIRLHEKYLKEAGEAPRRETCSRLARSTGVLSPPCLT